MKPIKIHKTKSLLGILVTLAKKDNSLVNKKPAKRIGEYLLVKKVEKKDKFANYSFSLGIYKKENKKFFIKTWRGSMKDSNYYSLINEYNAALILGNKLLKGNNIRFAKVVEIINQKGIFSVVYEYIDGKTLERFSKDTQLQMIYNVIRTLSKISSKLTKKEREILVSRPAIFYFASVPLISLFVLYKEPKRIISVLKNVIISVLVADKNSSLQIAHRDLDETNIVVKNKKIYVTDLETVALTLKDYDLIRLSVLGKSTSEKRKTKFLRNYIALHMAANALDNATLRSKYLNVIN